MLKRVCICAVTDSWYVPGDTSTRSPGRAESTAACTVATSPGTWIVVGDRRSAVPAFASEAGFRAESDFVAPAHALNRATTMRAGPAKRMHKANTTARGGARIGSELAKTVSDQAA